MNSLPKPKVSRRLAIPLVWVVPLFAVIIGAWMLIREYRNHGPEIVIDFEDGSGITVGKTRLVHKGVAVGVVLGADLKPDLSGVSVRLRLDRDAVALAAEGAQFWVVQPEISFSAVRGLDTILTGARINVNPGRGAPARRFIGLERPPLPRGRDGSRSFVLSSDRLGSINAGAPVFYREFKVGIVEGTRLSADSTAVRIRFRVEAPYVDLVRTNTRFWNAGGFSFKIGLFGAELKNTSLESLVSGGIAFATPDTVPLADVAPANTFFELAREPDKDWLAWKPIIPLHSPEHAAKPANSPALSPLLPPAGKNE